MSPRAKKQTVVPPLNIKEAEKVMMSYAVADAKKEQITSEMDERIAKIRDEYSEELQELTETNE